MRIFAVGSAIPRRRDGEPGVSAVHIVLHELVTGLAQRGHELTLQPLFNPHRIATALGPAEEAAARELSSRGIRLSPPIYPGEYAPRPRSGLSRVVGVAAGLAGRPDLREFYPAIACRDLVAERIRRSGADVVLTVWSPEGLAATHGLGGVPRVAYHGDVDFAPTAARLRDRALFAQGPRPAAVRRWREARWLARYRAAHLRLMAAVDVIANVTAANADFYAATGHRRSVYVPNVWRDPADDGAGSAEAPASGAAGRPLKIIGHVGKLGQTGTSYGLRFLLQELMPELERVMVGLDYQVHVIGDGLPVEGLRPLLDHPRVVRRGFVPDLDAELRSADAFLLLNNAGGYIAAYTRHVVAWAMGLCLVVHANSRRAIPEIVPLENALVGATPREVAEMLRRAVTDPDLNLRVRKGGRATFERGFTAAAVAVALEGEMERACAVTS
ncbi:MAG TPA: glycosyltransferase [Methylomirabilota bacterium]|jgi:glycosyltransferase involved in cell wall biosynthesis|nr:glycosyltransferase [Methylomirabilota bacterium]